MSSSEPHRTLRPPLRRIASNYLCTPHGLLAHPLVETDAAGRVVSVSRCTDPDRLAATEFHAGILLPAFVDACDDGCTDIRADEHADGYTDGCVDGYADGHAAPPLYGERHDLPDSDPALCEPKRHNAPAAEPLRATLRYPVAAPEPPAPHSAAWQPPTTAPTPADQPSFPTAAAAQLPSAAVPQLPIPAVQYRNPTAAAAQAPTRIAAARLPVQRLRLSEFPVADPEQPATNLKQPAANLKQPAADPEQPVEALLAAIRPDCRTMIVVDRPLSQPEIDRIAARSGTRIWWCLSFRMEERHFLRAADLLYRSGQPLCTGDGTPDRPERLALLARLQRQSDIPLHRLLAWSTSCAAAAAGLPAGEVRAGLRCGVNLLSGIDYETRRLTDRSRIRRIV